MLLSIRLQFGRHGYVPRSLSQSCHVTGARRCIDKLLHLRQMREGEIHRQIEVAAADPGHDRSAARHAGFIGQRPIKGSLRQSVVLSCTQQAEEAALRSDEHTSELQSLMSITYAVF